MRGRERKRMDLYGKIGNVATGWGRECGILATGVCEAAWLGIFRYTKLF